MSRDDCDEVQALAAHGVRNASPRGTHVTPRNNGSNFEVQVAAHETAPREARPAKQDSVPRTNIEQKWLFEQEKSSSKKHRAGARVAYRDWRT
jgi:hypothetical protein